MGQTIYFIGYIITFRYKSVRTTLFYKEKLCNLHRLHRILHKTVL